MNRFFFLLLVLFVAACGGTKSLLVKDPKVAPMIEQGKDLIKSKQYAKAATVLEQASMRPANQYTTAAIYLSGLAYFYQGAAFPAEQQFDKLLKSYPKSRYAEEARYHRALLMLNKYDEKLKIEGLNLLFGLADRSQDTALAGNALRAVQDYLFFQSHYPFLETYRPQAPPSHKLQVVEAMVYQKVKEKKPEEARAVYEQHLKLGGKTSAYIEKMLHQPTTVVEIHEPEIMKIGLFLPLFLEEYSFMALNSIPPKSRTALEFYEGFQKAVEDYSLISEKKIFVQCYDTQRDTNRIKSQLHDLEKYAPDVIVGEVYTDASQVIARWARNKQVPQVVPFSANPVLTQDSTTFTFLSRPSVATHGHRMAEYAARDLGLKNVVVWNDQRRFSDLITEAFVETFQSLGGTTQLLAIDSVYEDRAQEDILDHFERSLTSWDSIDGVYIPITNQESAGLILSTMAIELRDQPMQVMGTPNWEDFTLITQKEKETFQLVFTSPFSASHDSVAYMRYYNNHFREFRMPPSEENVQGYGLGRYLMELLDIYDPYSASFADLIRNSEPFKALHTHYYFNDHQDNQYLNILEYREGTLVQVN